MPVFRATLAFNGFILEAKFGDDPFVESNACSLRMTRGKKQ